MTRAKKIEYLKKMFKKFESDIDNKSEFLLAHLKEDSGITKEDVIELLLKFYNDCQSLNKSFTFKF